MRGSPTAQPTIAGPDNPFARPPAGTRGIFRLLRWSLIGADLVLCGLVALFVWQRGLSLTGGELAGCVIALGLGAWLSCLAVVFQARVSGRGTAPTDAGR